MKIAGFKPMMIALFLLILAQTSVYAQKPYKGAEVYSREQILYGRFNISMKMINGSGMLSTFFTMKGNSPEPGVFWEEIDIEVMGKENATIMGTNIITDGVNGNLNHHGQDINIGFSLADDYNTFTLEWTPEYVVWLINGTEYRRVTGGVVNDLTSPQTYRFNAWISCSVPWAGWIDAGALPQHQYIDWIEYYSYNNGEFTFEWRDDFNTFDSQRWAKAQWTFDCNEVTFVPGNANIVDGKLVLSITDPSVSIPELLSAPNNNVRITHHDELNQVEITSDHSGQKSVKLVDLQGRTVATARFTGNHFTFQYFNINPGVYLLNVHSDEVYQSHKILINR